MIAAQPAASPPRSGVFRQGIGLVAGRVTGAFAAAVWLMVAARALEPAAFGRLAVLIGVGTLLGVASEASMPLLVAEAVARDPDSARAVLREALRLRLKLTAAGGVLLVAIGAATGAGALTALFYSWALIVLAVQTTAGAALRGAGRVAPEAIGEAGGRLATMACGLALVAWRPVPSSVTGAYALGGTVVGAALLLVAARRLPPSSSPTRPTKTDRRAIPLTAAAVLVTVYNRVDLWLLAAMASARAAGLYAAVYRFYEGLILPATAFGTLLVPAAVREDTDRGRQRAIASHAAFAIGMTAVGAIVVLFMAPTVVRLTVGPHFLPAVPTLRLLAVAAVPSAAYLVVGHLASLAEHRGGVHFIALAIVVSTALNASLIPVLGVTGAGAGMVVSQSLLALLYWRSVRRNWLTRSATSSES